MSMHSLAEVEARHEFALHGFEMDLLQLHTTAGDELVLGGGASGGQI